ncbi:sulfotransferase family 2 domain-containing protein [Shewanella maritima]|uniref:sulfotransferase family 2 domain-containing protein n=1 Tax=Shewanella maritima TaxID=2520507 RepID=UPI0037350566
MTFNFAAKTHGPLARNPEHNFAMNHSIMFYRTSALYTFIPKNACSTLRLTAAFENGCIDDIKDGHWIHSNNQTFKPTLSEAIKADYTFVVLRCPFRRLASVFLDKFVAKEGPAWAYRDFTKRNIELDKLTFRQFVLGLRQPGALNLNNHWRPQHHFLLYKQYSDYFSVEKFPILVEKLKQKLAIEVTDARSLTNHGLDTFESLYDKDYSRAQSAHLANLKRQGKVPSYVNLYTADLIEVVKKLYQKDFELYLEHFNESDLLFSYSS